jgi:uncharacterized protein (DUF488 family)
VQSIVYVTFFTIGHSNRSFEELLSMLQAHGVKRVVDVRTVPGSRRNPQFMKAALASELGKHDIAYSHLPTLGGFRKPRADSPNTAWRNESFRGYADYMGTPEFETALSDLIALGGDVPTTVLCSEAVPWRCHRSLIADALTLRGYPVEHIMSETQSRPHTLTPFARVEGERVIYPLPSLPTNSA